MAYERSISMYNDLLDFLSTEECFIEAEAIPRRMNNFLRDYNARYDEALRLDDEGLIVLQEDANKWGLELRLYVNNCPSDIKARYGFTRNNAYRPGFSYRLNDNDIVDFLFSQGYRIGYN